MKNGAIGTQRVAAWFKAQYKPILMLLLVVAVAVGIFYVWHAYPEKVENLKALGYLGVFIISLGLNATVVLPAGNFAAMAVLATTLPPVGFIGIQFPAPLMVGIIGGLGAGLGESTGYLAGYGGQAVIQGRKQLYARLEGWIKRWGMLLIFVFSVAPLIFDLVGLAAGALRYPYWKFLIACVLGRSLLYITLAFAAVMGWAALGRFFG